MWEEGIKCSLYFMHKSPIIRYLFKRRYDLYFTLFTIHFIIIIENIIDETLWFDLISFLSSFSIFNGEYNIENINFKFYVSHYG